eukprot:354857-Chlamydomonas_euryale.AAC.43
MRRWSRDEKEGAAALDAVETNVWTRAFTRSALLVRCRSGLRCGLAKAAEPLDPHVWEQKGGGDDKAPSAPPYALFTIWLDAAP